MLLAFPDDVITHVAWRAASARVLLRRDQPNDAVQLVRQAADLAERTDYLVLRGHAQLALADVAAAAGAGDTAATAAARAQGLYQLKGHVAGARAAAARLAPVRSKTAAG